MAKISVATGTPGISPTGHVAVRIETENFTVYAGLGPNGNPLYSPAKYDVFVVQAGDPFPTDFYASYANASNNSHTFAPTLTTHVSESAAIEAVAARYELIRFESAAGQAFSAAHPAFAPVTDLVTRDEHGLALALREGRDIPRSTRTKKELVYENKS